MGIDFRKKNILGRVFPHNVESTRGFQTGNDCPGEEKIPGIRSRFPLLYFALLLINIQKNLYQSKISSEKFETIVVIHI